MPRFFASRIAVKAEMPLSTRISRQPSGQLFTCSGFAPYPSSYRHGTQSFTSFAPAFFAILTSPAPEVIPSTS